MNRTKLFSALMALMLLISVTSGALAYTPGTYEASARGLNGMVNVVVTFTEDAIASIEVKDDHIETPGVGDVAIEKIPADIIAAQSIGVDTITGVTMTSRAIINAVKDAAAQAGCDIDALSVAPAKDQELSADVVIVGANAAAGK